MPKLTLRVNGDRRTLEIEEGQTLLSALRDVLDLTGTKYGCGEAQCGACTVLLDGRPTRSCVTPAAAVAGKDVTTIEGIEENGRLHPVQQAFLDANAMQCGYCTAGMVVEAVALLRKRPDPSDAEIARAMDPHVCRCCTYPRIARAVRLAAEAMKPGKGKKA
jgi:aerobic-type carbon monoxide dehydrogenase small subunit (CoxS/CutS family)